MVKDEKGRIPAEYFEGVPQNEPKLKAENPHPAISYGRETLMLFLGSPSPAFFLILLLAMVLGAVLIPFLSPFDYASQNVAFANQPFFSRDPVNGLLHLFGTDHLGRDIFVRLWYGARISLTVAGAVALIDCVVGVTYGSISGYMGGAADNIMMRLLEVVSGIPYMVIVLLLMAILPRGIGSLIVAYSLVGWTGMARLVRGQVLSLKNQEFVVAAKIMGAGAGRIIFMHLLPNMLGIIIVNATLDIPGIIFTEAFLSMLGMGVAPPYPSLGVMANEGVGVFQTYPMQLAVPAIYICLLMLAFNLLGDRLQDVLDPKIRRKINYGRSAENKRSESVL